MKTGRAPARTIELAEAKKLKGVVMTVSPAFTPVAARASHNASVPDAQPTAWPTPTNASTSRSKVSTSSPRTKCCAEQTRSTAARIASRRAAYCRPRSSIGTEASTPGDDALRLFTNQRILAAGNGANGPPRPPLFHRLSLESNRRRRGQGLRGLQSLAPEFDIISETSEFQPKIPFRIRGEVSESTLEQRPAANDVPLRMMVKGNRDLNKTLQKVAFRCGSHAPDILERLVGFKESGGVKEPDALAKETIEIASGRPVHGNRFRWMDPGKTQ